jgi:hypothetical protein
MLVPPDASIPIPLDYDSRETAWLLSQVPSIASEPPEESSEYEDELVDEDDEESIRSKLASLEGPVGSTSSKVRFSIIFIGF